jgi:hypothetical protein
VGMGSVVVDIVANSAGFAAGIKAAQMQAQGFFGSLKNLSGAMRQAFGMGLPELGTAALVAKAKSMWGDQVERVKELRSQMKQLGATAEQVQLFERIGSRAGVDGDAVFGAVQKLRESIGKAMAGEDESVLAFSKLGLAGSKLAALSPLDALTAVSDAMAKLPTDAERATLSNQILGRESSKLTEVLRSGSPILKQAAADLKAMGGAVTETEIKRIAEAAKAWDRAKASMSRTGTEMAAGIAPAVEGVAKATSASWRWLDDLTTRGVATIAMTGAYLVGDASGARAIKRGVEAQIAERTNPKTGITAAVRAAAAREAMDAESRDRAKSIREHAAKMRADSELIRREIEELSGNVFAKPTGEGSKWLAELLAGPMKGTVDATFRRELEGIAKTFDRLARRRMAVQELADSLKEMRANILTLSGVPAWKQMEDRMREAGVPQAMLAEQRLLWQQGEAIRAVREIESPMDKLIRERIARSEWRGVVEEEAMRAIDVTSGLGALESLAKFIRPTQLAPAMLAGSAQAAETIAYAQGSRETEFGKLLAELRRQREAQEKGNKNLEEIAADIKAMLREDGVFIP